MANREMTDKEKENATGGEPAAGGVSISGWEAPRHDTIDPLRRPTLRRASAQPNARETAAIGKPSDGKPRGDKHSAGQHSTGQHSTGQHKPAGVRSADTGEADGFSENELAAHLQTLAAQAAVDPPDASEPTATPPGSVPVSEPIPVAPEDTFLLHAGLHDEGNAQSIRYLYGDRFLWNDSFGWMYYTDTHWTTEGAEQALERAAVYTLKRRWEAAFQPDTFQEHDKLRKFSLPNRNRVEGAKALLRSLVVAAPESFDAEPDFLNCANGVIDLRTGTLLEHHPEQRFFHCVPIAYRPLADPDPWQSWLVATLGAQTAAWLQMAVGYSLTGHTREEVLFYLYGPPRAGKGLFTETLLATLGSPLAKEIDFGTFTGQRTGDSQNFDLAPLKPARFIAASESNIYERFNEAKLKALTGGNEIYCAFKHHTHFSYRPQFKIWLSSNQPVNADPDDDAVWGRLRLIHFPQSHLGHEDKHLKARMRLPGVLEGVLAWAVEGARRWYALGKRGLVEPVESVTLKQKQRGDLDTVGAWIDECCAPGDHHFTPFSQLYGSYSSWAKDNGVEPKRQKAFSASLQHKGYRSDRATVQGARHRGFYGLKVTA